MTAREQTMNTRGTFVPRRCEMAKSPAGACPPENMTACGLCPNDFPSLSLMQPRIEAPTGRGIRRATVANPAPEGAPRPRIRCIGGTYECKSGLFDVGYGGTAIYAWNAWVSRFTSVRARQQ